MSRSSAYALLLLNSVIWGITAPIAKKGLEYLSVYEMLFLRFLLAAVLFLPFYLKRDSHQKSNMTKLVLLGILGTPLCLIPLYEGLRLTSSIEASLLTATSPLLTALGGYIFLKEKITKRERIGILVAMIGTFFVIFKPDLNLKLNINNVIGDLLIVTSNLIWTTYLLFLKKSKVDSVEASQVSYLVSVPILGFIALQGSSLVSIIDRLMSPMALFTVAFLAIGASIIAYWSYTEGQKHVEASEAAVFTYLHPAFAIPLAVVWLKEPLTWSTLLALFVIVVGVYISEGRASKYRKRG